MNLQEVLAEINAVQEQYSSVIKDIREREDLAQRLVGRHGLLLELKTKEEQNATSQENGATEKPSGKRTGKQTIRGEVAE